MEKTNFYIQLEVQIDDDGNKAVVPYVFDSKSEAEAKHFTVLAYAAQSTIPYHGSVIIGDDMIVTDSKVYDRRTTSTEATE